MRSAGSQPRICVAKRGNSQIAGRGSALCLQGDLLDEVKEPSVVGNDVLGGESLRIGQSRR